MPISTATESLISIYNQRIESDIEQISQISQVSSGIDISGPGIENPIRIPGPDEVLGYMNPPIEKIDKRIVEINTQIQNLKATILSIGQQAQAVGCGTTTVPSVTVTSPTVNYKAYSFSGENPWDESNGVLTTGNSGIGVQDSVSTSSIGFYRGNINTCYAGFFGSCADAPGGSCAAAASSITFYESFIPPLEAERDDLISKVNFLKNDRINYQLQRYGYMRSMERLEEDKAGAQASIAFLTDPANAEWL